MCVVKANCYGHGAGGVIPCLEKAGAKWYAVSNLIEAIELRELGVKGSIIILGYTPPENAPQLAEYDIIQAITEYEYAEKLCRAVGGGEKIRCHRHDENRHTLCERFGACRRVRKDSGA